MIRFFLYRLAITIAKGLKEPKMNSTKNVKGNRKMLEVTYHEPLVDYYKIPDGLDLEDKTVVKSYWVKYRTLYIEYVGKKDREEIETEYEDASDFKHPSNVQIEDADDNFVIYKEEDAKADAEEERKYQECYDCKSLGEEEVEEVEVVVEEIKVNGKNYYKDEKNVIYDIDNEERVGVWNEKENCAVFDEEETSDYMKELITCSGCEKETPRKDLVWKAGGYAYIDSCKECRQQEEDEKYAIFHQEGVKFYIEKSL